MKRLLTLLLSIVLIITMLPVGTQAATGGKLIALTFDDGPHEVYTKQLLDGLKERNASVTFFLIGHKIEENIDLVQRAYDEGHEIANHTWNHPSLPKLTPEEIFREVSTTNEMLTRVSGEGTRFLMRPPYGDNDGKVRAAVGMPVMLWSRDTTDWANDYSYVYSFILRNATDGAVILCHDTCEGTIPAALDAIDVLQKQGYEFVTVSELFRRRGHTLEDGVAYKNCARNGVDFGRVKTPLVSHETEENGVRITLTSPSEAPIYYTTDDTLYNQESAPYLESFLLTEPCTLRAVAAFNLNGGRSKELKLCYSEWGNLFADIFPDKWYYDAIDQLVEMGLMSGVGEYKFDPDGVTTRGMMVTLLYRYAADQEAGVKRTNTFPDVPDGAWYADAVEWAYANGVVDGYPDNTFKPDQSITRQEMAHMIVKFLAYRGNPLPDGADCRSRFKDGSKIAAWALKSVNAVVDAGLLQGYDGYLNPLNTATRAEFSTVLIRMMALDGSDTPEEEEPTEPSEPAEPSEPTNPGEPPEETEPTYPTEDTEPTDPSEETDPTEPPEDTEPTDPTEETEPREPSWPS